jgi:hypothetical protein
MDIKDVVVSRPCPVVVRAGEYAHPADQERVEQFLEPS